MNRGGSNLQRIGRLFNSEPTKKSKFNNLALARINCGEFLQSVEGDESDASLRSNNKRLFQRYRSNRSAPLLRASSPGEIHQDATHQLCREGKKVSTIA